MFELFKKKPADVKIDKPKKDTNKRRTVLTVRFKNGSYSGWTTEGKYKGLPQVIITFYKWYFGRPQSKSFIIKWDNGEDCILRENIDGFSVNHKEA